MAGEAERMLLARIALSLEVAGRNGEGLTIPANCAIGVAKSIRTVLNAAPVKTKFRVPVSVTKQPRSTRPVSIPPPDKKYV